MTYKASYDTTTKILSFLIVTASAFIILLTIKQTMTHAGSYGLQAKHFFKLLLPLFMMALVGLAFLFSVKHYTVENNQLHIHRWKDIVSFDLSDIVTVRNITAADTGLMFRTFGVGGLFGYFGKFHSAKLGTLVLYATQNQNKVLIELVSGKKIVITPDDVTITQVLKS